MKIREMTVGRDYFVTREREWVKAAGMRMRLLYPSRISCRPPGTKAQYGDQKVQYDAIYLNDQQVPLAKYSLPSYSRPGEDTYALMASVTEDGTLREPEAVHLSHVAGLWEMCHPASTAYRAAMDTEELHRSDLESRITRQVTELLGREVTVKVSARDEAITLRVQDLEDLLAKATA